jgi:pimeloyl-ACP methyl ester carboxylesterase
MTTTRTTRLAVLAALASFAVAACGTGAAMDDIGRSIVTSTTPVGEAPAQSTTPTITPAASAPAVGAPAPAEPTDTGPGPGAPAVTEPAPTTTAPTTAAPTTAAPTTTAPADAAPATTSPAAERPTAVLDTLVAIGETGARLHIRCVGQGRTTVLLLAGFGNGGDSWGAVEPTLSESARICSYARYGTGSSDPPPRDQTFTTQATDLHDLLEAAAEPGPYVVVGHSFGGAQAVTFAAQYPDEVRGVLLLDASPTSWPTAVCAVPDDASDMAASFRQVCASISDPRRNSERLDAPAAFGEAATVGSLGQVPLVVATAAAHPRPGLDPSAAAELEHMWSEGQRHWTSLSSNAQLLVVEDTGHDIQLDQPGVVIEQVRSLIATAET